ncbi:hypothetical protein K440DRAFT_667163 [Wilcoxina mikolae CBS 423.85]|nr:hypothetical protein K440DRAFT_667163 [Wilcoxina mikolae CBS 423.85]
MSEDASINDDGLMRFNTYAEYVEFLYRRDPRFEWLHHLFTTSAAASDPTKTHVMVADSEDGRLTSTHGVEALQSLENRSPRVKTRLVLVRYDQTMNIDRNIIDAIAFAFDLDPFFLWRHFDQSFEGDLGEERSYLGPDIPPALPSKKNSLDLGYSTIVNISTMFLKDAIIPDATTEESYAVVMLARNNEEFVFSHMPILNTYSLHNMRNTTPVVRKTTCTALFETELLQMSREDIFSADENPIEYIYPWAQIMADNMASDLQNYATRTALYDTLDSEDLETFDELLRDIHMVATAADDLFQNLLRFLSRTASRQPSRGIQSLTRDYEFLLRWAKQLIQFNTDHLNRRVGQFALRESQKSIELANSVKILSELAFVFLPLSLSAGLFGMNITELGTGKSHLWIYFLTAAVFQHPTELSGLLQPDNLSAFWSKKIQEIFEFTSQKDWNLNFFHKRLFSRFRLLLGIRSTNGNSVAV